MLDKTREYRIMAEAEDTYWWYKVLHKRILITLESYFKKDLHISILDSGCGTGGLMNYLKQSGYNNIVGYDLSDLALDYCASRGLKAEKADVSTYFSDKKFDVITSCDLLCYVSIEDNYKSLQNYYNQLNENGILILNLPALKSFKGMHDIGVGLLRRYELKGIKELLLENNFKIIYSQFWPFLISPVILVARIAQRIRLKIKPGIKIKSDIKHLPALVNSVFYNLSLAEMQLFKRLRKYGSSLFIVAIKKN
jgi:SAM-dependent methyltransferase